ncbi:MAG: hypothetical protein SGPRY_009533, partial [Prymnesium sp.]
AGELVPGQSVLGQLSGADKYSYVMMTDEYDKAIEVRLQVLLPPGNSIVESGAEIRMTLVRASGGGTVLVDGDLSVISDSSGLGVVTCGREHVCAGRWRVFLEGRGTQLKEYQITYSTVR